MDEAFLTRAQGTARRRTPWGLILGVVLAAFLLGGAATWLLLRPDALDTLDIVSIRDETTAPVAPALPEEQAGSLDRRIAEMEQRLAQIDLQADAAAGNATRAEGLLIAFAARRAVDRGDKLGYLAGQLRARFGAADPEAVETVLAAERDPITLDRLLARLDGLAPHLGRAPAEEGAIAWISREMSELFVVRREDAPSPAPVRRIERARQFLQSGRPEVAVQEVRNLPDAPGKADWIADAQRYAAAQRALERLEAAAILEPRALRRADGEPMQPAGAETPAPEGTSATP